ncbi:HNH endonuclease [bacterium]|nr:HNH endonuclease [bacterium]
MIFAKGHRPYNVWLGKQRFAEDRKKISETLKKLYDDPTKHPQYKGNVLRSGYYYIKNWNHPNCGKQGYVAVHRLVMGKHIGRILKPGEVVHHKNHNTLDNRIENLELFSSPGEHTKECHPESFAKCGEANRGIRRSRSTEFKKGMVPWNKK